MTIGCPRWGLIAETKHLMASEFVLCKVRFCSRVCNRIAHELASIGCKLPSSSQAIWEDVPLFIEELVTSGSAGAKE
jgi:hypothetical protein